MGINDLFQKSLAFFKNDSIIVSDKMIKERKTVMKVKVIISILFVAVFVLCTVACGNSKTLEPDTSSPMSAPIEEDEKEEEADTTQSATNSTETTEAQTSKSTDTTEDTTPAESTEGQESEQSEEESSESASTEAADSGTGEAIANTAKSLIGTKFEYGKVGQDTFDNPGFVVYCYKENGISIPRRTKDMTTVGTKVSRSELKNGDIVIFSNEIGGEPDFSGIYIGGGQFISCNTEETPTGTHSLDTGHWSQRFIEGRHLAD